MNTALDIYSSAFKNAASYLATDIFTSFLDSLTKVLNSLVRYDNGIDLSDPFVDFVMRAVNASDSDESGSEIHDADAIIVV